MRPTRRTFLKSASILILPAFPAAVAEAPSHALIIAARKQIGITTSYDPAYRSLTYPMGDVPEQSGVCTDVIVRAYRTAFGFDFQKSVHEDMRANFSTYPRMWGLSAPDRNIDHRRVPNLETYLARKGHEVWDAFLVGDLVSLRLGGRLPHIAIVSRDGDRFADTKIIHNIGSGTKEEAVYFDATNIRHFRFMPASL